MRPLEVVLQVPAQIRLVPPGEAEFELCLGSPAGTVALEGDLDPVPIAVQGVLSEAQQIHVHILPARGLAPPTIASTLRCHGLMPEPAQPLPAQSTQLATERLGTLRKSRRLRVTTTAR